MKQKVFKLRNMVFLFVLAALIILVVPKDVSAATKCKVTFANANGVVANSTYRNWGKMVEVGSYITLPKISTAGYRCYWVVDNGTTVRRYLTGSRVKITGKVTFCLNRYKLYNVRFYTATGQSEYTNLRMQVIAGQYIALPTTPTSAAWKGLGWATTKGSTNKITAGTKIRVNGNMNFYGVYQRIYTVKLYRSNGTLYRTAQVPYGSKVKFPVIDTNDGNMFLGWSRQKGKTTSPQYYAGSYVPTVSASYYMVEYPEEADKAPSTVRTPSSYDMVYFVGDSRTYDMAAALGTFKPDNVKFICKSGEGLAWLQQYGFRALWYDISRRPVRMEKAIVFNLGVNDMKNASLYVNYYKQLAAVIKKYNCDLYIMSVNPVNSMMIRNYNGYSYRTEQQIDAFNSILYKGLCTGSNRSYTYINTCYNLRRYGWISNRYNRGINDGVHYSPNTYLKIYDYCIRYLNR